MNVKRLQKSLEQLNYFTDDGKGINRLAYTDTEMNAKHYLMDLFEQEGMTVKMDAIGNVIARREGMNTELPAVAIGSHIDSVYEAGKYDGTVGVVAALEVIRSLNDASIETEHPIEVISFACEESARFGYATLGSKAMAGLICPDDVRHLKDKHGQTLEEELKRVGLDLSKMEEVKREKEALHSFLELHIEQGPVLENKEKQIGIVNGIAGPTRFLIEVDGQADHSGSTPMDYRKDALLGGSEIALSLERAAQSEKHHGTVATVGDFSVSPGAMNIIPSRVVLKVDIRGIVQDSKNRVIERLYETIEKAKTERRLDISVSKLSDETPVNMDEEIISDLKNICEKEHFTYELMPSGAGHDAMNMAQLCPSALIFIPSKDGLSHNPNEYTTIEQIATGTALLKKHTLQSAKAFKGEMSSS